MSGTARNYSGVTFTIDGVVHSFGSMTDDIGEATLGGDCDGSRRMSVGAADYIVVWDQDHSKLKFTQLGFRIIGDGTLQVAWRHDLYTSTSDYTILGTRKRWKHKNWPCKMGPFWLCDQTALGHATLANESADNAGVPSLWTTYLATAETQIIDRLAVRNPGTAPVIIEVLHLQ